MYFETVAELLAMDGHGPYVWAAYGITFATLVWLVAQPLVAKRRQLRELRGFLRRTEGA
ncbi:heme exporter protein D [Litorivivens lipolytica]|uniref:Heme exporter protein D n=1 Tax=Litorivivens lipolytica TaxID=1524264 RepID=A0A7W4W306_9GAMM|nr:heme exporter protein CcmD [Litorivivens lipolytica]MBB3046213.1 heme exporter protein D [Litorivivens lipolytica]